MYRYANSPRLSPFSHLLLMPLLLLLLLRFGCCRDPFRMGDNILVLCDTYEPPRVFPDGTVGAPKPIPTNSRFSCAAVMEKAEDEEPW